MTQEDFFNTIKNISKQELSDNNVYSIAYKLLKHYDTYLTNKDTVNPLPTSSFTDRNKKWLVKNYCDILDKILETVNKYKK